MREIIFLNEAEKPVKIPRISKSDFKEFKKTLYEKEARLKHINDSIYEEHDLKRKKELEAESKRMCADIRRFLCEVYAKKVFDVYSLKKPKLVRRLTNEVVTWDDAFGTDFSKIPASSRESLVGLVEGGGKYKLKKFYHL